MRSLLTSAGENCLLTSKSRKFMMFFFLPAIVAGAVALTSGAAVFHKIQNVLVRCRSPTCGE